jgi:transposase
MPAPTPPALRQRLWQLAQQGAGVDTMAAALGRSTRTVRRLLARFRPHGQPTPPDYRRCGRPRTDDARLWRERVLTLRRAHRGWGAERIRTQLRRDHPGRTPPATSTLRRWLAEAGLAPVRQRPPRPQAAPAGRPHQVWQMDAKDGARLRSGLRVCWLRLVDEASGAFLFSWVFPYPRWALVPATDVQGALRRAFARWGRPDCLRVDNGRPWVDAAGVPTDLEFWLAGLDVGLSANPPATPQANGVVERSQRTGKDWADPGQCDTPEELQRRLDEEDRVQRQWYPYRGQLSRLQVYPALCHSGRAYAVGSWEEHCWDLDAALACLDGWRSSRKVGKDGAVSVYNRDHLVGTTYAGQVVEVTFDRPTRSWVFWVDQAEVGRSPAVQLTQEGICGMRLGGRPGRSAERTRARRAARAAHAARAGGPGPGAGE